MRFGEVAQSAENDEYNKWDIDDTRRPKLTLKHLNKMRGMKEIAKAEHTEQASQWKTQYGASASSDD
jgi:hypothetical protein